MKIPDATLRRVIHDYTREAGVRQLEREIAALTRKATRRIVSNGHVGKPLVMAPESLKDYLGAARFVNETRGDDQGVSASPPAWPGRPWAEKSSSSKRRGCRARAACC